EVEFFRLFRSSAQTSRWIVIACAVLDCDFQNVPQNRDCVIVGTWAGLFAESGVPSFTVLRADFSQRRCRQVWPGLEQGCDALFVIGLASRLERFPLPIGSPGNPNSVATLPVFFEGVVECEFPISAIFGRC